MSSLQVLAVASEIYPLIKTGGLADVAGALPLALARENIACRSLVPGYPAVLSAVSDAAEIVWTDHNLFGGPARLLACVVGGLELLVLDAPHLFARPGSPYAGPDGREWYDNPIRFAALSVVGALIARGAVANYAPDIVHAHDWQAGLTLAYLNFGAQRRPGTVMTIHNLAFQGQFPAGLFPSLGLPPEAFSIYGIEHYGAVGYLKAGLYYADRITTVSPGYAAEIQTHDGGMGLDGLLRGRAGVVSGILNGIDVEVWDPATDPLIARNFDATEVERRRANKTDLQARLGLDQDANAPLFGVVSRLSWQKGVDLLLDILPTILGNHGQLGVLGSGDPSLESGLRWANDHHRGRVTFYYGYDEALAHRFQAGADAILVPSRFEPCGLTQLCAQRYGAVPIVARVGGLSDTVIDANPVAIAKGVATGIQFAPVNAEMLRVAIDRAVSFYRRPALWRQLQANGLATDVSWRDPARRYAELYRGLLEQRR